MDLRECYAALADDAVLSKAIDDNSRRMSLVNREWQPSQARTGQNGMCELRELPSVSSS